MIKNRTNLQTDVNTLLPDNTSELITPALHRTVEGNILDSNLNVIDTIQYKVFSLSDSYITGEVVIYQDTIYVCILNSTGNLPTDPTYFVAVSAPLSTDTNVGLVRRATSAEVTTGTATFPYVTPATLQTKLTFLAGGRVLFTDGLGAPTTHTPFTYSSAVGGGRMSIPGINIQGSDTNAHIQIGRTATGATGYRWSIACASGSAETSPVGSLRLGYRAGPADSPASFTQMGIFRNDTGVYVPTTDPTSSFHYYWAGNVTNTVTAAGTPIKIVSGSTTAGHTNKFVISANRATCTNPIANLWYEFTVSLRLATSVSTIAYIQIYKNGVAVAGSRMSASALAGTAINMTATGTVQLSNTDYIEVFLTTDDSSTNTVGDLTITGRNLTNV